MVRCFFNTIDSTNTQAQILLKNENDIPEIFSIIANKQTKGRGKIGSVWKEGEGNLYLSIVLKIGKYFNREDLGLISLLSSLSVREALNEILLQRKDQVIGKISNLQVFSKWPNDILVIGNFPSNNFKDDKLCGKISGILLEVAQNKNREDYLIVGIGVNLLNAPKVNKYQTISLFDIISERINNIFFADILEDKFFYYLNEFQDNKINIIEKFKKNLYLYQQEIKIKVGNIIKTGIFFGMTDSGYLILNNGKNKETITAGEIFGF